jgi:hypothetical protein
MMAATDFIPAIGDLHGLPTNENHLNVKWRNGDVWFSYTQKGEALSIHFSSDKHELRRVHNAVNSFCSWLFDQYPWAKMILAIIGPRSVVKLATKCGFKPVTKRNGRTYMARVRE